MVAYGMVLASAAAESKFPASAFLDYEALKASLYELERLHLREPLEEGAMSLSMTPATNAAAQPMVVEQEDDEREDGEPGAALTRRMSAHQSVSHETFLATLDAELRKMDAFAHAEVSRVRADLRDLERASAAGAPGDVDRAAAVGDAFLEVERYVNVNVTAVRKVLKKHDKVLPQRPIKGFYTARMHDMRWVRNDYSDVVVRLSRFYAGTAGAAPPPPGEAVNEQSFVRATTKYWVRNEDLSAVKLALSRHLPVLVRGGLRGGRGAPGAAKDSQLVNSVYLDSPSLELYHGRLAKLPGAVALRLRWYGTGEPKLVYVERKTHRDGWTGDESVKERFAIDPAAVPDLLAAAYDPAARGGGSAAYGPEESSLISEVQRLISAKGLVPTVRTQCHRTAFQLEHTNAVRASIDTNLCLINEVQPDARADGDFRPLDAAAVRAGAGDGDGRRRWYRDARVDIPRSEITRFPLAVLELKLALAEDDDLPAWLRPVVEGAALAPVHKFSKFVHGCAVLLPDEVQAMPYWIDDPALAASIRATGNGALLKAPARPGGAERGGGGRRRETWTEPSAQWARPRGAQAPLARWHPESDHDGAYCFDGRDECDAGRCYEQTSRLCDGASCLTADLDVRGGMQRPAVRQRVEPKLHFANERTFVHWLHAAVVLVSFGAGAYAVADGGDVVSPAARDRAAGYAAFLSLGAAALATYAALTFKWRARRISSREPVEWGDPQGPLILGCVVIVFLLGGWIAEVKAFLNDEYFNDDDAHA